MTAWGTSDHGHEAPQRRGKRSRRCQTPAFSARNLPPLCCNLSFVLCRHFPPPFASSFRALHDNKKDNQIVFACSAVTSNCLAIANPRYIASSNQHASGRVGQPRPAPVRPALPIFPVDPSETALHVGLAQASERYKYNIKDAFLTWLQIILLVFKRFIRFDLSLPLLRLVQLDPTWPKSNSAISLPEWFLNQSTRRLSTRVVSSMLLP